MLILAAILTASINVDVDLSALFRRSTPRLEVSGLTCGISTVGYRFSGKPGQRFRYAGDEYEVPAEGYVELIADPKKSIYRAEGKTLPLNVWPLDQFGFRRVSLPGSQPSIETE